MYVVALWLLTTRMGSQIAGLNLCFSVPTKVVARMVNRASGISDVLRPMVRSIWLSQAGLKCYIKALYQADYTPWLYESFCHFQHVNIAHMLPK